MSAETDASPVDPSAQMALMRVWLSLSSSASTSSCRVSTGKWRSEPAQRQREILPHPGVVVLRLGERLGKLGREDGFLSLDELRVGHQPRELVRRRPPPVAPARPYVGEVLLGRSILAEQAAKTDVDQHRGADDQQRDEEELNGDCGRCAQRFASARLSLD